ncbi:FliH/SctL family protein [Phyllobacterium salinisoli]|nr:FliH/SctL family protein [Phyllobacterium salinisoli]
MQSIALAHDCPLPADGVISAEAVNSLLSMDRAAKRARWLLHRHIERIREVSKTEKAAARQRGYADGLKIFLSALEGLREEYRQHYEQSVALVRKCLEQILLQVPSEAWLDATITSVLKSARDEPELSIMIHPDNLRALENIIAKRKKEYSGLSYLKVEANPTLASQDCIVYAGQDVIDVSVPILLDELCLALSSGENDVSSQ